MSQRTMLTTRSFLRLRYAVVIIGARRMKPMTATDIESFRRSLGLSQAELADRLGVSQASVSQWESGKKRPRKTVLKLLDAIRATTRQSFQKTAI